MTVFQKEEVIKTNELERDFNGLIQRDSQKKMYKDRSAKIEHYSLMLRDEKITVKRFLKTMANVDNKIVFAESDFPTLDTDEIEFDDSRDKDLYIDIVTNLNGNATVQANDSSFATSTTPTIIASTNVSDALEESKSQSQSQPPVMTRSKARKASKQKESAEASSSSSSLTNANRKRRLAERGRDENEKMQLDDGSKRAKVCKYHNWCISQ